MSEQQPHGRIWETADNLAEALKWLGEYSAAGSPSIEIKPRSKPVNGLIDDPLVDVIVTVPRTQPGETNPILGRSIDAEEWMIEDGDGVIPFGERVFVSVGYGALQLAEIRGWRRTAVLTPDKRTVETFEYEVILHDEEGSKRWVRADMVGTDVAKLVKDIIDAEDAT